MTLALYRIAGPRFQSSAAPALAAVLLCLAAIAAAMAQSVPVETKPNTAAGSQTLVPGRFVDITEKAGVHFLHQAPHTSRKYLIETMGSGVALFDCDNDGRLDLYLVNGAPFSDPEPKGSIPQKTGPQYWNRMYHQKPDGTFEDITEKSGLAGVGYGMGVAVADYDNDGYEDLFVTGYGGNRLYHNNGDCTFTDVTEKAGVTGSGWSTSAAWVDLDNDGLLDLVVDRYVTWDWEDVWCGEHREGYRAYCHPDVFQPIAMLVYHNDGSRPRHWALPLPTTIETAASISLLPMTPCPNSSFIRNLVEPLKNWVWNLPLPSMPKAKPTPVWAWISPTLRMTGGRALL
jgi:hypothetical protein